MWKYFFGKFTEIIDQLFSHETFKRYSPFIMGVLSRWYLLICIPAVTAVYYAFKGLKESGMLDKIEAFITEKVSVLVNIAQYCTPKIGRLKDFIDCLNLY